jgi:hypothetical protein
MGGGGKRQSGSSCALLGEGEHASDLHIEEREYAYLRATGGECDDEHLHARCAGGSYRQFRCKIWSKIWIRDVLEIVSKEGNTYPALTQ